MRVLFVSPAAELGGSERSLLDCIFALRESGVDVRLLAFADGPLLREARSLGVSTEVVAPPSALRELSESTRPARSFASLLARLSAVPEVGLFLASLRRAIVLARADIVHTNGMKAHVLAGLVAPRNARLVVHLRDFIGSRRMSRWLLPRLARWRSGVTFVANSHAVGEDFKALAPDAQVHVVHNVVDTDLFAPGLAEADWLAALAELEPPAPEAVSFGLVATYARWKGHELFIQAAGLLRAKFPARLVRFYVVGGPIYQTLGSQVSADELLKSAKQAQISDCFGLVPFQTDIVRVYRSLNVVVHASTEPEPFGRTIVEAMACERPVIVANAGGAAELFQHGENALGFVVRSAPALAEAMAESLDPHTRARLGRAAREHAVAHFGRARLAKQLREVYGP